MAETAIMVDEEEPETQALDIHAILEADNIAELLDENELAGIGQRCIRDFAIDEDSRKDWLADAKRWRAAAMQAKEAKNFPWPKAANVKFPLLIQAALQFQATAYPVIVDGPNIAKGRVLGADPDGEKQARADRIAQHMSWQLLFDMPDWEEETDSLLLNLPIMGCGFRKSYYDDVTRQNCAIIVPEDDMVVNYWFRSFETAPRYTQIVRLYPNDIRERVLNGRWIDPGEVSPTVESKRVSQDDDDAEVEFLEQHRLIDLDDDGYAEPYVVTLTREGKIVRITAAFTPETVTMNNQGVVKIERRCWFTRYLFFPSPDGSFYGMGFGKLLDDLSDAINAVINQSLDAGTLQNAQGGFLGSGVNIKGGPLRAIMGEWKRVDVTAGTLRDNILPLQLPGPSPVLLTLLEFLIDAARGITSVQDIMTGGEQNANTPATTTLAQIDQAMKVMKSIFKRIHRSFGKDLQKQMELNRENLDEDAYFNLNDDPQMVTKDDYQDKDLDVVPVSDPTMVSDAQRHGRAGFLIQSFKGDPGVNQAALNKIVLEAAGIPSDQRQALLDVGEPKPDPMLLIEGAKLALEKLKIDGQYDKDKAAAAKSMFDAAMLALQMGMLPDAAVLAGAGTKAATESTGYTMEGMNEPADRPGAVPGMEEPPVDGAVPGLPQGSASGLDGGMGPGGADEPGIPADGEVVGGVGGPVL
jgi:chaperonin GroES